MKPLPIRAGHAATLALAAWALLGLASGAQAQTPAAQPFKFDAARAQQLAEPCLACHTADGSRGAPANPILQGQFADYLFKQLADFKAGRRKNPIMQGMVAQLSEADMKQLAAFYAGKAPKAGFAKNKELVQLGESLYRGGNLASEVPACSGCHSPTGSGIPAQFPRLSGQHAEYTEGQLVAFKNGTRGNAPMMAAIAAKMSEREMKAVADYIAGLR